MASTTSILNSREVSVSRSLRVIRVSAAFILLASSLSIHAQNMDKEIASVAEKLGKVLVAKHKVKVAVTDFSDLQGRPTELGRFLAEQLSVELVNTPGISVVDRSNTKRILAEHKLTEEGLVSPENAKQLGRFAGVDVILIGTVTSLDDSVALTVKGVATDTAELVAASKATFPKTKELHQFLVHGVSSGGSESSRQTSDAAVAIKEFGDFRITLKNIRRISVPGQWGSPLEGIQCIFAFENRNLREGLVVALNGQKVNVMSGETAIRSQISNSSGRVWMAVAASGISTVRVAGNGSPSAIAETLRRGRRVEAGTMGQAGDIGWVGELTTLSPGESLEGAITFSPAQGREGGSSNTESLQLECELVVGLGNGSAKNYRLHNWIAGNLSVSGSGK